MSRIDGRIRIAAAGGLLFFAALADAVERGWTLGFDLAVRAAIHSCAFPALTVAMRLITATGSGYFLVPLGAILVWRWERRGEHAATALLVAGSLSAEALSELLKTLFHRPRPEVFFGLPPVETYSFPSGHAFVPAVYFGILAANLASGGRGRAAVAGVAVILGFSRVYLGYHYPSDVAGGWALALVWLTLWAAIAERRGA